MLRHAKPAAALLLTMSCIATAVAQGTQQDMAISANVPSACTTKSGAPLAAINTTIPVTAAGAVNTAKQNFVVNQVVCTKSVSILATSMNGGVKSATNPGASFTNIINYKGSVQYGAAKSEINTATIPTANGPESGTPDSTGGPRNNSLIIHIEPLASALPLAGGTDYQDTLRITLTPD